MKEVVSFITFIGMVTCLVAFVIVLGPLRVNVAQGAAEPADCWTRASAQLGCGLVTLVRSDSSRGELGCYDALRTSTARMRRSAKRAETRARRPAAAGCGGAVGGA